MANSSEPSSSLSFTSSSHISNGSISHNFSSSGSESVPSLEVISLSKLSSNLEQLLVDSGCDYSDADIIVEGISVGVHRCILASRSSFFCDLFKQKKGSSGKESRPKYCMSDLLPYGDVGYEAFLVFLSYVYTGKLKPSPMEVSTCVHNVCAHDACRPAINFVVELMYASSIFQMPDLVSIFQRRLLNFVGKALADDVIPILVVAFHCQLSQLIAQCIERVARSDIDSISLEKGLPDEVIEKIKILRRNSQQDCDPNMPAVDPLHEKRIRRIHKALDSDDVELVKLLLKESAITLDEANALHYAAAYCDPKVVTEVLGLGLADVNLRNSRGYTVLHIAVMRKEPSIIVLLLTKGARASELTSDGQSAVSICRRLTRPKDYHSKTEQGQEANKDRICIDVLEREMRRNPMAGVTSISSQIMPDDLHMKLLNLENRVAFARLLFPAEAKLAMVIAHAETTSEFAGRSSSKGSSGNLMEVDLNETPTVQNKRLHSRLEALMKTVDLGRFYFPHCSEVLDKFIEDDLPDLFYLEMGTSDEQKIKRVRFMELKEEVHKAFNKDKAELNLSGLSSSSSTSSPKKLGATQKVRKL
ncbi:PREDICTED: regulatory protein NPR3-like [Prunus mume]|uniref:Regulatory protein NPR3-like n=1 Tax=Prunus mume TaxID=102107 RepID=A0ABM0NJK7_PRUMU|nr:PREDICTED: regulatory protein NPR3-like [Prunus mume]